jgi:hypothetical protein
MVDQSLVTSGFDIEVLLSARYVRYALLAQIEAGLLPMQLDVVDPAADLDAHITIHPPSDHERLYDPEPGAPLPPPADGSFDTSFIFDDPDGANLGLSVIADVLDNTTGQGRDGVTLGLMLEVALDSDLDDRGFESGHRLSISLVKLDPLTQLALGLAGIDVAEVTEQIKAELDRSVPFGVADGQSVQRAVLRPLRGGDGRPAALAVYVNLALKDGEEADEFVDDRGDPANGVNYLDDGRDLAFATSPQLFGLLGRDMFFRMAEEDPDDPGSFRHPLRENPHDPASEEIGTLKGVSIGPELAGLDPRPTGRLLIDVHGEYTLEILPDPDFHLLIFLEPVIENGLLRWDVEVKVDVGIFGSLLSIVAIVAATVLSAGAGLTLFLILLAADLIIDAVATAIAADRADSLGDATFLDALPHRLTVARRRWDPLYETEHQVVALLDAFTVNRAGLAFDGGAVLDKEPAPIAHVVIRNEQRGRAEEVSGLEYRVRDLGAIAPDLAAVAPGTDRLPFAPVGASPEADLVALTLDQIADRIAGGRLVHPILYVPRKVHLVDHTIRQLLVASSREVDEQRGALIRALRRRTDAEVRAAQGAAITAEETDRLRQELGREPTQEEIDDAVGARVSALVDDAEADYRDGDLPDDVDTALDRIVRFDLAPREHAALQDADVLVIEGKEIIRMRSGTVYYRDHPDFVTADNLLSLERYRFPYVPAP